MNWIFLALLSVAIWAVNNIVDKVFLEKYLNKIGAVVILVGLTNFVAFFVLVLFFGLPAFSTVDSLILIGSGVLLILDYLPYLKALTMEDVSRVIPLYQTIPIFMLIMSFILLGESFSAKSFFGFLVVLVGTVLISLEKLDLTVFKLRPCFWYMILASFVYSLSVVLFKFVAVDDSTIGAFTLVVLGCGIGSLFLLLKKSYRDDFLSSVRVLPRKAYGVVAVNETLFIVGKFINVFALVVAPLALVSLVENAQPVFVFIYALLLTKFFPKILKEDFSREAVAIKAVSLVIITIGALLI